MDWDPSREYDSRTFSDDCNLHGASARSFDHPSVTRDDNFFNHEDLNGDLNNSIENLDLIADIVDGKTSQDHRTRLTWRGQMYDVMHRPGDNSVDSITRYMLNGMQDQEGYLTGEQHQLRGQQFLDNDHEDQEDDYGHEGSSNTPVRQQRNISDHRIHPKGSPVVRRNLAPAKTPEQTPRMFPARNAFQEGQKSQLPRLGLKPPTVRKTPGPDPRLLASTATAPEKGHDRTPAEPPKTPFRSALKPLNNTRSKRGRHIQLPKEVLDYHDTSEHSEEPQMELKEAILENKPVAENLDAETKQAQEEQDETNILLQPTASISVPGPSRFTRVSKKNVSPAKKTGATIPTPLDDEEDPQDNDRNDNEDDSENDKNKAVQQSVRDLKVMLGRLGLLPLSPILDISLERLTATDVAQGGLCEMMGLLTRLGVMYEKQKEVIHQMTDQILSAEMRSGPNPETEGKLQLKTKEVEQAQAQTREVQGQNRKLESQLESLVNNAEELKRENDDFRNEIQNMALDYENIDLENEELRLENENFKSEIEELQQEGEELRNEIEELVSKANQSVPKEETGAKIGAGAGARGGDEDITGNEGGNDTPEENPEADWSAIEEHLQRKKNAKTLRKSTASQQQHSSKSELGDWKGHIQTIEQELVSLKSVLDRHSILSSAAVPQDELEERLGDALVENKRLQLKNKSLTKELLVLHEEEQAPEDMIKTSRKLKSLLKDVMTRIGVDNHQNILPALTEFQKSMDELATMRKFVNRTERIIWESEIAEGTVKIQHLGFSLRGKSSSPTAETELSVKHGKTCSQSYEATLQRLREWSELLDVLNHVDFADDGDDTSSTATIKPTH
ncbi:hypothetical protein BG004_003759 [Podila humilis]|nr:hypothetical protein BG004_003759 [Podila humilis]